jgi:hypothetical protein
VAEHDVKMQKITEHDNLILDLMKSIKRLDTEKASLSQVKELTQKLENEKADKSFVD